MPWFTVSTTSAANKPVSPSQTLQVAPAALLGLEELAELDEITRVVDPGAGYQAVSVGHAPMVSGQMARSKYPLCKNVMGGD